MSTSVLLVAVAVLVLVVVWPRKKGQPVGGAGRVCGIVGRMGSGKSYFAVRMAWRRLEAGANVCTNFSMNLPPHLAERWTKFHGWEQFAELENAVVIVDEAHLWAPSSRKDDFPTIAKWKLSMARKFRLDLYWITQHEDRVNRTLRDLTNVIYLCQSWFGGLWFTAKGYEPEMFRRKNKHIDRKGYLFRRKVAQLYDTLEVLGVDGHMAARNAGEAETIKAITGRYNAARGIADGPPAGARPQDVLTVHAMLEESVGKVCAECGVTWPCEAAMLAFLDLDDGAPVAQASAALPTPTGAAVILAPRVGRPTCSQDGCTRLAVLRDGEPVDGLCRTCHRDVRAAELSALASGARASQGTRKGRGRNVAAPAPDRASTAVLEAVDDQLTGSNGPPGGGQRL